jgi:integrase
MAIYRRGKTWWYSFILNGDRVQESTQQHNRKAAKDMEQKHRTRLVEQSKEREEKAEKLGCKPEILRNCADCGNLFNGDNPITSSNGKHVFCSEVCEDKWQSRQSPTPTFAAFAERFKNEMQSLHEKKPKTLTYYTNGLKRLLEFVPFREARLDRIDEQLVAEYIRKRKAMKKKNGKTLKIATTNRELEVLRRMLRIAVEWKVIHRAPKISRQPGEEGRERVLNHAEEAAYLGQAKQPLRDIATAIVDAGFRPEEVFRMRWENVHLQPAGKALYGYVFNPHGKTKYSKRNVSMTARVKALLEMRHVEQGQPSEGWVFPAKTKTGHVDSMKSQHKRALKDSGLALAKGSRLEPIVLYSFRHTMLTRLGEAGADAFTIQKIAGHGSILVSQKYVHPTPEKIETAFTQLEAYNSRKETERKQEQEREQASVRVQ